MKVAVFILLSNTSIRISHNLFGCAIHFSTNAFFRYEIPEDFFSGKAFSKALSVSLSDRTGAGSIVRVTSESRSDPAEFQSSVGSSGEPGDDRDRYAHDTALGFDGENNITSATAGGAVAANDLFESVRRRRGAARAEWNILGKPNSVSILLLEERIGQSAELDKRAESLGLRFTRHCRRHLGYGNVEENLELHSRFTQDKPNCRVRSTEARRSFC